MCLPWVLAWAIIPILTVLTSMGIIIYQIYSYMAYDDWKELSIIDSILFSFGGTTFARQLENPSAWFMENIQFHNEAYFSAYYLWSTLLVSINFIGEFITAWIGVIILGVLFFLIHLLISQGQLYIVEKVHGEDPLKGLGINHF